MKVFRWYSFPDTALVIPLTLVLGKGQTVSQSVEAVFDTLPSAVRFDHPPANLTRRFTVAREETLRVPTGDLASGG